MEFRCSFLLLAAILMSDAGCVRNRPPESLERATTTQINVDLAGVSPPDLAGLDLYGNSIGTPQSHTIGSRTIYLKEIKRVMYGVNTYGLQVDVDDVVLSFSCVPTSSVPASYSISSTNVLTVCGTMYTVTFPSTTDSVTVNSVTSNLNAGGLYSFRTNGSYHTVY